MNENIIPNKFKKINTFSSLKKKNKRNNKETKHSGAGEGFVFALFFFTFGQH